MTYTALIVCSDKRSEEFAKKFSKVFDCWAIRKSKNNFYAWDKNRQDWRPISQKIMPKEYDVLFFHTGSNDPKKIPISWQFKQEFAFNSTGNPSEVRRDALRVVRALTSDNFLLTDFHVQEIFDFVKGSSTVIPFICKPYPSTIPAIHILCQGYLAIHAEYSENCDNKYIIKSLKEMGFDSDNSLHLSKNIRKQKDIVQNIDKWWVPVIGDKSKLENVFNQEWLKTEAPQEREKLKILIDVLIKNEKIDSPIIVAEAYLAINSYFKKKFLLNPNKVISEPINIKFKNEEKVNEILAFSDDKTSIATAFVLATLLSIKCRFISSQLDIETLKIEKRNAIVILTESQIKYLAALRRRDYSGAVLVLCQKPFSQETFDQIKRRKGNKILMYGQDFHQGCEYPYQLTDIINKIGSLMPMREHIFGKCQRELKANAERLDENVFPYFENLQQENDDFQENLSNMAHEFTLLLTETVRFRHYPFSPPNSHPDIREMWEQTIEEITTKQKFNSNQIETLEQIFQRWRNHVLETAEGF